tara:strand:+ start:137 stop:544 length:408 start_codon:yes stop_codon:yes gene_type:complete
MDSHRYPGADVADAARVVAACGRMGGEEPIMLIGKFFHTRGPESREIHFQGQVLDYLPPKLVLVQLFSFVDGRPTAQRLLEVTESWDFYDTNEEMLDVYDVEMKNHPVLRQEMRAMPGHPWDVGPRPIPSADGGR